jgi:hypothetical protein
MRLLHGLEIILLSLIPLRLKVHEACEDPSREGGIVVTPRYKGI